MLSSEGGEGGVTTRARKRKVGQRDVWDLIVNNDDICFQHILPRLNGTDVKFLYEVNTETRALIKRSTRAGDLERRFNICLLYTSPSPRDLSTSRMPSSA